MKIKKVFSFYLAIVTIVLSCFCIPDTFDLLSLSASAMETDLKVGDVIKFGSYPQSILSDKNIIAQLELLSKDNLLGNEVSTTYGGIRYIKNDSRWYIFEDISWRILDVNDGKYFVQSEKVLDWQAYNSSGVSVNWNDSSLKKWLNSEFVDRAFEPKDENLIDDYLIESNKCKMFIISYDDAVNTKYGFSASASYDDQNRVSYSTSYAQAKGASSGACNWMLRSLGIVSQVRYALSSDGCVGNCHSTKSVSSRIGIRPAMVINYGKQVHTVSNYYKQNADYADKYFNGYALACDGYNAEIDLCIPELTQSFNMIPQGIAFYEKKGWILISAYHNAHDQKNKVCLPKQSSKIFALDAETGKLVAEYSLKNVTGEMYTGHAGGIAVSDNNLYITDVDTANKNNSLISYIPLSQLTEDVDILKFAGSYDASGALNNTNTSYVSFSDGVLWTGNCYGPKNGKRYSSETPSVIIGYCISGSNSEEEWNSFVSHTGCDYLIDIPKNITYIQCATVIDGRLIIVSSYGRKNDSTVYFADINSSCQPSNIKSFSGMPMMEGFYIYEGEMAFITESGSYYYYGYDKSNMAVNPTDVVWILDYTSLLGEEKYPFAQTGDINGYNAKFVDDKTGNVSVNFKQSWFGKNSLIYNHELGQFCSQFAMIGYDYYSDSCDAITNIDIVQKPNLEKALKAIGMDNIEMNTMAERDEVNYFIASRNISVGGENKTLVFAGFIGSYLEQWFSNFDPGIGETHKGFNNAKNYVYAKLQDYISRIEANKTNTKILLTGHSRGAATANLVAAQLIKDEIYAAKENIYTYAFATPNSTQLSEKDNSEYKRIFNIVNPEDFVTKCMPSAWKYGRYGRTLSLPSKDNSYEYQSYLSAMKPYFSKFKGGDSYCPFKSEAPTYNLVKSLTDSVKSVDQFYMSKFKWAGVEISVQEFFNHTLCAYTGNPKGSQKQKDAEAAMLRTFAVRIGTSDLLLDIIDYFIYEQGLLSRFGDAHCAQTYCAYMMSMTEAQIQTYRSGLKNSVNCPVDIDVVDKSTGEVVGRIVNNEIDEKIAAKDNAVTIVVDGDSKQFWLPSDGYYDIVLTGNDNGKMDYSVSEIDSDFGEVKRSNFFDVDITHGGSMTGLPEVEEASLNDYGLELGNDETLDSTLILETEDLRGIEIETASFGKGTVTEPQTATMGDYIVLNAAENEDMGESEFIGWFINGELYSTDKSISFVAKEDFSIKAEFTRYLGDSNGDNRINSYDALNVLQYSTDSVLFNQFEFESADVNKDGDIDSLDALIILQYSVGIIEKFESIEE